MPKAKKVAKNAVVPGNAWFKEWQEQVLVGATQPRKQLIKSGRQRGAFAKVARKVPKVPKFRATPIFKRWQWVGKNRRRTVGKPWPKG